jgi:hypothetical protein
MMLMTKKLESAPKAVAKPASMQQDVIQAADTRMAPIDRAIANIRQDGEAWIR